MANQIHPSRRDAELRVRVAMVSPRQHRLVWFAGLYAAGVGTLAVVAFGLHALMRVLG
jgi:hypothetical protein